MFSCLSISPTRFDYLPLPMVYCRAQNVGGGKHWRIPLKTTLANSNEKQRTLAICIADVELPSIIYAWYI